MIWERTLKYLTSASVDSRQNSIAESINAKCTER